MVRTSRRFAAGAGALGLLALLMGAAPAAADPWDRGWDRGGREYGHRGWDRGRHYGWDRGLHRGPVRPPYRRCVTEYRQVFDPWRGWVAEPVRRCW
jgi:hypothetical protein